jgi:acetoacetyl-CoA synthetase
MQHTTRLPLWNPSQTVSLDSLLASPTRKDPALIEFARYCSRHSSFRGDDYSSLLRWSKQYDYDFWIAVWEYCKVKGDFDSSPTCTPYTHFQEARWFPNSSLNFGENVLRGCESLSTALVYRSETRPRKEHSGHSFARSCRSCATFLSRHLRTGDRIAAYVPHVPEAVMTFIGASLIGALWTAVGLELGSMLTIARLKEVAPSVLLIAEGYWFKGTWHSCKDKINELIEQLPSVTTVVVITDPDYADSLEYLKVRSGMTVVEFSTILLEPPLTDPALFPFNHPLHILYSSGTTGTPKRFIHGAGGVLLEHLKEHRLHLDFRKGDIVYYQTSVSWMMWNWAVSALASGCTLLIYDGYPLLENGRTTLRIIKDEDVTVFGTSAKFLSVLEERRISLLPEQRSPSLRAVLSTGSPLSAQTFDYVNKHLFSDVPLCSISGGTDLVGCFALGVTCLPVYPGEIQSTSLGLDVAVLDADGNDTTEPGELVCKKPFPSQPLGLWNDSDGSRYHEAYFSRYPNIWHHGDWAQVTPHNGLIIFGRSDSVLNPGGVRIGTGELYTLVRHFPGIVDCIAVGHLTHNDEKIILFLVLSSETSLTSEFQGALTHHLRTEGSPFHVPAYIFSVSDIPRTHNGKIMERLVRDIVNHQPVGDSSTLANPEVLGEYHACREKLVR